MGPGHDGCSSRRRVPGDESEEDHGGHRVDQVRRGGAAAAGLDEGNRS